MPTRKQRRREAKLRRHEWEEVYVDPEGRELAPDDVEAPPRNGRASRAGQRKDSRAAPRGRGVQPPSWRRVLKRGAIFAPVMFLTVHLIAGDELSTAGKALQTGFLLLVFLPFSYVMDTVTYRMFQRRQQAGSERAGRRDRS